jgi:uncharacterized protein (TIGR00156 family)
MRKFYILPIALLFGASSAWAQSTPPQKSAQDRPGQSAKKDPAPTITSAQAVATAKDDQKVQLRGKIVSKQKGNEYMFQDSTGSVLVEIGSRAVKGDNKQLAAGTEVEIQGEVDTRGKDKTPKVEAKQVTVVAASGGMGKSGSSGSSAPMRNEPSAPGKSGGKY